MEQPLWVDEKLTYTLSAEQQLLKTKVYLSQLSNIFFQILICHNDSQQRIFWALHELLKDS